MKIEVLGNVQDGGVPHLGCTCQVCGDARDDRRKTMYANLLGLRQNEDEDSIRYIIGASSDIRHQIVGQYLDGMFLVDNNYSHLTGLLYLGEFSSGMTDVPVYAPGFMQEHLMKNDPYRLLIDRNNVSLHDLDGDGIELKETTITPRQVAREGETVGTLAYFIEGPEKSVYYAPVIEEWNEKDLEMIEKADIAIIEGCFWKIEEVPRYADQALHPTIPTTMEKTSDFDTEIYFTHINHTNPVLIEDSKERQELEDRGFNIAEQGQEFDI